MSKKSFHCLLSTFLCLGLVAFCHTFAAAQGKADNQQFGATKEEPAPKAGKTGPLRDNICRNPKLCDSMEIDLLDSLHKKKVPVFLPEAKPGKAETEYQASLNLGIAVADALASVTNQDKQNFLKYAAMVRDYGKKLGVSEAALGKYTQITQEAEKNQWDKLGISLYEFKDGIINELTEKNQKPLAALAMVSGGLEGLYIAAQSVDGKYSEAGAKLLNSKDMLAVCQTYLGTLSPEVKGQPGVKAIGSALPELEKLMAGLEANKYAQGDVKNLLNAVASLRKNLLGD